MYEIALTAIGGIVLSISAISLYSVFYVAPITMFIYSNARIHARASNQVLKHELEDMSSSSSLQALVSRLKEKGIISSSQDIHSFDDLASSVYKRFIQDFNELIRLSPKKIKPLLNAYLMQYESRIIKDVYRRIIQKKPSHEMIEIGMLNSQRLEKLKEAKTLNDASFAMFNTFYEDIFTQKFESIEEFEISLDRKVLLTIKEEISNIKVYDSKAITELLDTKIDIINILQLIKFRLRNIKPEDQEKYLIPNYTKVWSIRKDLISSKNLKEFTEICKDTRYYTALSSAFELYESNDSFYFFEKNLYASLKSEMTKNELAHLLGPYPLISYIIKKELNMKNIFITIKALQAGLQKEKISEMLI